MNSRNRFVTSKRVQLLLLAGFSLIGLTYISLLMSTPCNGFWLERRACLYLQSPRVWFAPDVTLAAPQPEILATQPIPASIDPKTIKRDDEGQLALSLQAAGNSPGGFIGINGTWGEQFGTGSNLFIVSKQPGFEGELAMGIFNFPQPLSFIASCLLDFVQVPCDPKAPAVQSLTLKSEQAQHMPIRLNGLQRGLHDLVVVIWDELKSDSYDSYNDQRFTEYVRAFRTSLTVEGDTTPQAIEYQPLPIPYHVFGLEGFVLTDQKHPWDTYGGFPPFTYLRVQPGEEFELYLHLFNLQKVRVEYALAAFIDYEQVPIGYNGNKYLPLYFSTKAEAWYPLPIKIKAPLVPGHHEFTILGEHFPQARMDLETSLYKDLETLSLDVWSSYRIYLDVAVK